MHIFFKITSILSLIFLQTTMFAQKRTEFASSITASELKSMLYHYASDDFMGRETGTKGHDKAVDFLKSYYIDLEIDALKNNGEYFQNVPLSLLSVPEISLSMNNIKYKYYDDYVRFTDAKTSIINSEDIVFVNYGIETPTYNNYKDLDVKGKIVIAIGGEPKDSNGNYIISKSNTKSKWSNGSQSMRAKLSVAESNGAIAFFLIDQDLFKVYSPYYKYNDKVAKETSLSLNVGLSPIPAFLVGAKMGERLLEAQNNQTYFKSSVEIDYKQEYREVFSENVLAYIKGSEKPEEFIILSAHLDHVGSHDGEVYNGADDDGSGTVAILEIAEAFKLAKDQGYGPKRSVIFFHLTAEEKGLLGSEYYTDYDPIVPLKQTVANLNIDMIGRTDPKRRKQNRNYLYLIGSDKLSTELHELSENVNKTYSNIDIDYKFNDENDPNRFYYRSDHYNFAKNNIPVIFYFNGTHEDYHKATDTPDKIQYDLLENRTRLIFHTAWELANRPERIKLDQ